MVTASVMANSRNRRPTTSPMNSSGISTAISEIVSDTMVKPICSTTLEGGLKRRFALLDIAGDVLDHHDGVVDDEARGDRERHQRKIVEAEAQQIHGAEGADQRQRHREAGDDGRRQVAQEQEDHQHDQHDGKTSSNSTSATEARIVIVRSVRTATSIAAGSDACSCGQQRLDAVDHLDDVGAGLALDVEDDRGHAVHPGAELACSPRCRRPRPRRRAAPARRSCRR